MASNQWPPSPFVSRCGRSSTRAPPHRGLGPRILGDSTLLVGNCFCALLSRAARTQRCAGEVSVECRWRASGVGDGEGLAVNLVGALIVG